jgi:DNA-binding transcriptional ArsR family regulator
MAATSIPLRLIGTTSSEHGREDAALDQVFFALADPVRRAVLAMLDGRELLVSEIAGHFVISLQAVSKHIQVLVRAGLVRQERTGRISRCSLVTGPIFDAAVWLNRYSKYWQAQFDLLAASLAEIDESPVHAHVRQAGPAEKSRKPGGRPARTRSRRHPAEPESGTATTTKRGANTEE